MPRLNYDDKMYRNKYGKIKKVTIAQQKSKRFPKVGLAIGKIN
ncbi:hypothetical protein [Bacillus cereus group sp. BfR-BA-01430]|nr:hypothetical protein [Bacillus cereus group sp. BfR-BA-01430]